MRTAAVGTVRRARVPVALLMLLVACSDATTPDGLQAAPPTAPDPSATTIVGEVDPSEAPSPDRSRGDRPEEPGEPDGADDGGNGSASGAAAIHPGHGVYVYAQGGWEEFCQAAACSREQLPSEQPVDVNVLPGPRGRVTVVSEARVSESRLVRTTTVFTRAKVLITEVVVKFDYGPVRFTESYEPAPPVESVLWPLHKGRRWSGEWTADTAGSYRMEVEGEQVIPIGTRRVPAFKIDTKTEFTGDFEGRGRIDVWIDPETGMLVKTAGRLDLSSVYGDYRTEFLTALRTGPGY